MNPDSSLQDTSSEIPWYKGPVLIYLMVIAVGAVCIALAEHHPSGGLAHLYLAVSDFISRKFTKGLGEALIISGIVGLTIDHYNLKRHRDSIKDLEAAFGRTGEKITEKVANEVSANGIMSVYKTVLSDAILSAISKDVLKAELTRTTYNVNLMLRQDKSRNCVIATQSTESEVANQTQKDLPYQFTFVFDKPECESSNYESKVLKFSVGPDIYLGEKTREILTTTDGRIYTANVSIRKKQSTLFVLETRETRGKYDCIFWSTLLPTDSMQLTVLVPDEDVDFVVETLHPEEAIEGVGLALSRTWKLNGAALPGQGFLVKWRVRDHLVQ